MSRIWIESLTPGFTTMAFIVVSLIHKLIEIEPGLCRFRILPLVVLVALETTRLRAARRLVALLARGDRRHQHIGCQPARLCSMTRGAARQLMRGVIEARARHPGRDNVCRNDTWKRRRRLNHVALGAGFR